MNIVNLIVNKIIFKFHKCEKHKVLKSVSYNEKCDALKTLADIRWKCNVCGKELLD